MVRRAKQTNRANSIGYTLIEMTLAILIVGVIAGSVLTNLDMNDGNIVPASNTLEQAIRGARPFQDNVIERSNEANKDNHYRVYYINQYGEEVDVSEALPDGVHLRPAFKLSFNGLGQPLLADTIMTKPLEIEVYTYENPFSPDQGKLVLLGTVHVEENTGTVWTESP
jgi:type II secretory pathway pseudopilin PulG